MALGDTGEVLPRVMRGTLEIPAQGWYAKVGGETVFLGDHEGIAYVKIAELTKEPKSVGRRAR
jgi:hypothetical protein